MKTGNHGIFPQVRCLIYGPSSSFYSVLHIFRKHRVSVLYQNSIDTKILIYSNCGWTARANIIRIAVLGKEISESRYPQSQTTNSKVVLLSIRFWLSLDRSRCLDEFGVCHPISIIECPRRKLWRKLRSRQPRSSEKLSVQELGYFTSTKSECIEHEAGQSGPVGGSWPRRSGSHCLLHQSRISIHGHWFWAADNAVEAWKILVILPFDAFSTKSQVEV